MAYCTQQEIEAYSGYVCSEFRNGENTLTTDQWSSLLTLLISGVTQAINVHCNRKSFEINPYTEYHDGRGMTGNRGRDYRDIDRIFFPWEQPVVTVSSVSEDTGILSQVPHWILRAQRSNTEPGDYMVVTRDLLTYLYFFRNVPRKAMGNVQIVYTAGFQPGDPVLAEIKLITLEFIKRYLQHKKRELEGIVATWNSGTQEGANLIQMITPVILDDELKFRLAPYVRSPVRGLAWH